MSEKPILFSTSMVRAILDGRKTMTRRVVKPQPDEKYSYCHGICTSSTDNKNVGCIGFGPSEVLVKQFIKPPWQPGDLLYVQETWKISSFSDKTHALAIRFKAGGAKEAWFDSAERYEKFKKFYFKKGWQSPYFMPKAAARIWLTVTDVRVERLQEIAEEDARAEGIKTLFEHESRYDGTIHSAITVNHMLQFRELWDSLNAKRGYDWVSNPWVWVISFERRTV